MTEEELFEAKLEFASVDTAYCVLDQRGFEQLSSQLQGSSGMRQLLREISAKNELWAYSSDQFAQEGLVQLKQLPRLIQADLVTLPLSMALVLNQVELMNAGILHVNYGLPWAFDTSSSEVPALKRLALLLRLTRHPSIWVLSDARGVAMLKERGGKRFAVGFLAESEGDILVHKSRLSSPGCKMEPNKPKALAVELLHSPIEGIILDYKLETETTLVRDELEIMLKIANQRSGTSFALLKKIIRR